MKKRQEGKLPGSATAKRQAAVILEVLAGVRGPREGSEAMGVSLNRYYQLESRALGGLITALEPLPKGRRRTPDERITELEREKKRLEQEVVRQQALVRAAHRSRGVPVVPTGKKGSRVAGKGTEQGPGSRRRRRVKRGAKVVARLRRAIAMTPAEAAGKAPLKPAEASS